MTLSTLIFLIGFLVTMVKVPWDGARTCLPSVHSTTGQGRRRSVDTAQYKPNPCRTSLVVSFTRNPRQISTTTQVGQVSTQFLKISSTSFTLIHGVSGSCISSCFPSINVSKIDFQFPITMPCNDFVKIKT